MTIQKSLVIALLAASVVIDAASNQHIDPRHGKCEIKADFAADVFDLITENPQVILSGTAAEDANAFAFIRRWVQDGKSRTDLVALVWSQCPDSV